MGHSLDKFYLWVIRETQRKLGRRDLTVREIARETLLTPRAARNLVYRLGAVKEPGTRPPRWRF